MSSAPCSGWGSAAADSQMFGVPAPAGFGEARTTGPRWAGSSTVWRLTVSAGSVTVVAGVVPPVSGSVAEVAFGVGESRSGEGGDCDGGDDDFFHVLVFWLTPAFSSALSQTPLAPCHERGG